MPFVLGLDIGTSGAKAIAVDEAGGVVASALIEYPLDSPKPLWAEQAPETWRDAAYAALAALASKIDAREVKAIGLTGQMHGSVFLDKNNDVIRPALLWCDQRTAAQCTQITEKVGEARLLDMVSNPALTGFTAPKILWLREHEPEHFARLAKVLLPKDYVRHALTGDYATDVADASGTLLFDVRHRKWHTELMGLLGLDPAWFPPTWEGPEVTGTLSAAAAARTGLRAGIPVVAGGGDQAANGVGCGVVREGIVSASLGTSGVVFAFAPQVKTDPQGRAHTFCHAVPGAWHMMGVVLSAAGSLRWFRDTLCADDKACAQQSGLDVYDVITAAAAEAPAGSEALLFLPYLTGERTPHKDPDAKGAFIGLTLRHSRRHMARAVLEGVAYAMRDSVEILRKLGVPVREVRTSGGGARSRLWRQILADVIQAPMITINVEEGPAYGAAVLACVAAGWHKDVTQACDVMIDEVGRVEPEAGRAKVYDAMYHEYAACYKGLAPVFKRLTPLAG